MIERSFVMLPKVGLRTEQLLWHNGITSWEGFVQARSLAGISDKRLMALKEFALKVIELERRGRVHDLGLLLPSKERWRLLRQWDRRFAALDLEVIRRGHGMKPVVVTIRRGSEDCRTFVSGDDLCWRAIRDALEDVDFLVTFNGSSFDLPLLTRAGYSVEKPLQIDLRRCAARAGLSGGLKEIENALGIRRPRDLEFSTSEQVSYLWRLWEERGSKNALDLLIRYNQQDVDSLVSLSNFIYRRLAEKAVG